MRSRTPRPQGRPPLIHRRGAPAADSPAPKTAGAGNQAEPARTERPSRKPPAPPRVAPQRDPDEGYVAVGRVLAPFGLKGEMKVQSLTDNPRRFTVRAKLWAGQQPVSIASAREAQGHLFVTFKGYPDRTSVERFRHAILQVPESELPALEEGEYYRFQLLGLAVFDREGNEIGVLEEVIETGSNDVYRVRTTEGDDVLLPALKDVVLSVDLKGSRMVVDPPAWR